jgi:hypothetical protein
MENENKNFFRLWEEQDYDEEYRKVNHWQGESKTLLDYAWKLGNLNLLWVDKQLSNCDKPAVCKQIIIKCRNYQEKADLLCLTNEDREFVKDCLRNVQNILYAWHVREIANYCMNN